VTRSQSPLDAALDLFVYVPVGLVLTAAEEIPRLAAKGRARVGGQVGMAKVVGQFAVAQGRKEITRRLSAATSRPSDDWEPRHWQEPLEGEPGFNPVSDTFDDLAGEPEPDTSEVSATVGLTDSLGGGGGAEGPTGHTRPEAPFGASSSPPGPDGLAIPGYDSLAASQVVPRLAGLSPEELAAVGAYESAHRARRTILTRIRQLQER
jgi:hypothetical protein